ncbi:hypothetical protein BJV77DRAFT_680473 [Russula vinacea]|nr:hypothetical protein BJV77DRAFT_680473 [Russula vinacea]
MCARLCAIGRSGRGRGAHRMPERRRRIYSLLPWRARCTRVCCGRRPLRPYPERGRNAWWNTSENRSLLDDTLKTASSAAFLALEKTRGYIVSISIGGQLRVPDGSVSRGLQPISQKNSSRSVNPRLLSFVFSSGNLMTKMENYRHRATEHPQFRASTRSYSYEPRSRNNRHRQEQVLLLARLRSPR